MSSYQDTHYRQGLKALAKAQAELAPGAKRAKLSWDALHLMRAVCAEPYCRPRMKFVPDQAGTTRHLENSPKMRWLLDRLAEVKAEGEKAIVFTELREVQTALLYFLRERLGLTGVGVINGTTERRQDIINRFSARPGFNVIILSTLAAGAGLNVVAANHVFHFTRAWNPAKENQATDRAYRIGQTKDVYVYRPIVAGTGFASFEQQLDDLLRDKDRLFKAAMEGDALDAMLDGQGEDAGLGSFSKSMPGDEPDSVPPGTRVILLTDVDAMLGEDFEQFCAMLWTRQGFDAQATSRSGDGGVDVVALRGKEGLLVQCKTSRSSEIGWDAVKEVVGGSASYQQRFPGVRFARLAITNQKFNANARAKARDSKVRLIERQELNELLSRFPIRVSDFEDVCLRSDAMTD
jgi:Holliday junction resolvase